VALASKCCEAPRDCLALSDYADQCNARRPLHQNPPIGTYRHAGYHPCRFVHRQNPQVFIVYYDSTALPGQGEGVYFSATAVELRNPEDIRAARQVIHGYDSFSADEYSGNSVCRIYRATPTRAWMNTFEERDGVFIRDFRIEIPLSDLRLAVSAAS
jgi:hypothetical protein